MKKYCYFVSYIMFKKDINKTNIEINYDEVHYYKIINSIDDLNAIVKMIREHHQITDGTIWIKITILNYKLLRIEKDKNQEEKSEYNKKTKENYSSNNEFSILQEWVKQNLQTIMKRSLKKWMLGAELISNIRGPKELEITTGIRGSNREILLIGTMKDKKELAIVLPGSYIGAHYYGWFILPKGTNERVEETIEPAVLRRENDGTYSVIMQGKVKQD